LCFTNLNFFLPRTQARSSRFERDWDFSSVLPASFASTLNVSMVHCAILLDGSCSRVFRFPHLRRLGTRQNVFNVTNATLNLSFSLFLLVNRACPCEIFSFRLSLVQLIRNNTIAQAFSKLCAIKKILYDVNRVSNDESKRVKISPLQSPILLY